MYTVTSFNKIVRQITEMSQRKKVQSQGVMF